MEWSSLVNIPFYSIIEQDIEEKNMNITSLFTPTNKLQCVCVCLYLS